MASKLMGFLQMVAFVTVLFSATTLAEVDVQVSVEPETVIKKVTDSVSIFCKLANATGLNVLIAIKLEKKAEDNNTEALATIVPGSEAKKMKNNRDWKVEGKLNPNDAISSFLNLTISDPKQDDAGQYICSILYLDALYQSQKAEGEVSLDKRGDTIEELATLKKTVKDLQGTVADLENNQGGGSGGCTCNSSSIPDITAVSDLNKTIELQQSLTAELQKKVADLENKKGTGMDNTTSDGQDLAKQNRIIAEQGIQLEKQQNWTKELEQKVSNLMKKLEGNGNVTSGGELPALKAQEQLIAEQGERLSEQKNITGELEKKVTKLQIKSAEHSQKLSDYELSLKSQVQSMTDQMERLGKQENGTKDLEGRVSDLEQVARQQNSTMKEMKKNNQEHSMQLQEKVSDLEEAASEQNSTITELKQRAQAQAKLLEEQVADLRDEAIDQNSTIIDMKQKNLEQVTELKKMMSDLEGEFMKQNVTVVDQAKTIGVLGQLMAGLGTRLDNLTGDVKDSPVSAFSVGFSPGTTFTFGGTLTFGDVLLNMGNHYNTSTGVYTAQWDGLYVFHLSALVFKKGGGKADIQLVVNNMKKVASLYDNTVGDQATINAVVNLKAGDTVKPTDNSGSNSINPIDHYSLFSGYLLKLL